MISYDNNEMFRLNLDMEVHTTLIEGKYLVVIIDNVYENPDMVRDFVLQSPLPQFPTYKKYGYHRYQRSDLYNLEEKIKPLLGLFVSKFQLMHYPNFKDLKMKHKNQFLCNVFSNFNVESLERYPHSDKSVLSSILYLNPPPDDHLGTAVCRHKLSDICVYPRHPLHVDWITNIEGLESSTYLDKVSKYEKYMEKAPPIKEVSTDIDNWEIIYQSQGKYNSMITYFGGLLHYPVLKNNKPINITDRLTQAFFWE
ncbi:MAG: hypothetical protein CMD65_02565 [Gammaproteobacteria bacterium]|nr:hypothetical protein [Gammaproteobacteria bacterium]